MIKNQRSSTKMSKPLSNPEQARQFAVDVVGRLRAAGHEALWAGGCVRDELLGRIPADYDVATAARPDEVRRVFGHGRTLAVGAAFGVITVLGPKGAGQIEVATFRTDAAYTDGRHPAGVTFSTAPEDAQRRDFTINGLFFDPLTGMCTTTWAAGPIWQRAWCGRSACQRCDSAKTTCGCSGPCGLRRRLASPSTARRGRRSSG
jgi:hypothetical protein